MWGRPAHILARQVCLQGHAPVCAGATSGSCILLCACKPRPDSAQPQQRSPMSLSVQPLQRNPCAGALHTSRSAAHTLHTRRHCFTHAKCTRPVPIATQHPKCCTPSQPVHAATLHAPQRDPVGRAAPSGAAVAAPSIAGRPPAHGCPDAAAASAGHTCRAA
eukprot:364051-Chlamydomonas_euryale.AAC.9